MTTGRISRWSLRALAGIVLAGVVAWALAAPWMDQRLVPGTWVGLAVPLLLIRQLRTWYGCLLMLVAAAIALAIAFRWSPHMLADTLDAPESVGTGIALAIIGWEAIRVVLPFCVSAMVTRNALVAWLPAGLAAVVVDAAMPAVFPWKFGYTQLPWSPIIQSADLLGPDFTTFIAYAHAGVLVWLVHIGTRAVRRGRWAARGEQTMGGWKAAAAPMALAPLGLCAANLAYGWWAIGHWQDRMDTAPSLDALVVQTDPSPDDALPMLQDLTQRACRAPGEAPELICWPECSGGSYEVSLEGFGDDARLKERSRKPERLRPLQSPPCALLLGAQSYAGPGDRPVTIYQSALLVDGAERIAGRYHKRYLMPFGEYTPCATWIPWLKEAFPMKEELTAAQDACVLATGDKARIGVMLCYEDIVPSAASSQTRAGANVLISLINGSAFNDPLALAQHRMLAQMRAVECRRSFIRCAATGETCVITAVGAIQSRLRTDSVDVLRARVPLLEETSIFCRIGPVFPPVAGASLLLGLALRRPQGGRAWLRRRSWRSALTFPP